MGRRRNPPHEDRAHDIVPAEIVPPSPADLIESLRDFGYTLPTAVADLVDNSITASARNIRVILDSTCASPHLAVIDDGIGMGEHTLIEAMRLSGRGPLVPRDEKDLGRFGLGLKTASLSQGKCLTVITKHRNVMSVRRWDLSHIRSTGAWQLLASPTNAAAVYVDAIATQPSGTAVVIEDLDRLSFLRAPADGRTKHLGAAIQQLCGHLGMVFHRFISEDDLGISVGQGRVSPWDPYLAGLSTELPTEAIGGHGGTARIAVTPFVLPHHSRLTDEQHASASGMLGWNDHQGFYVYRGRRLIVPGSWLNLQLRKEEHLKLARIRVDIPNTLDSEWHLNVIKSHVAAPAYLRDSLKRIAKVTRQRAAEVYRVRGERQAPSIAPSHHFVWRRVPLGRGVRFRVDRTHPVVRSLLHAGCDHDDLLENVIELLESTLPVSSILQEPARSLDGMPLEVSEDVLAGLVSLARHTEQHLIRIGKPPHEARELVLTSEPFLRHRSRIEDALENNPI
jgi:hypothetical protein